MISIGRWYASVLILLMAWICRAWCGGSRMFLCWAAPLHTPWCDVPKCSRKSPRTTPNNCPSKQTLLDGNHICVIDIIIINHTAITGCTTCKAACINCEKSFLEQIRRGEQKFICFFLAVSVFAMERMHRCIFATGPKWTSSMISLWNKSRPASNTRRFTLKRKVWRRIYFLNFFLASTLSRITDR